MFKRDKLLSLLALALLSSCVYWGCDQPDDVLTPLTKTNIWLEEEKLPSNPGGMVYELWAANSSDTISLGKFGYDFVLHRYLEVDGTVRADSNKFFLGYDVMDFTDIIISVETYPDDNTNSPGPVMLFGPIIDQTIKLRFPQIDSLWLATVWYNMESASDGLDPITDGYGVWFCSYTEMFADLDDTAAILDWGVYIYDDNTTPPGTEKIITTGIDPASIVVKDTGIEFGLDTVYHQVVRFELTRDTLYDAPYYSTSLWIDYDITPGIVAYDNFNQGESEENPEGEFDLPLLDAYGWTYKGWVASPYIDTDLVKNRMTLPAWRIFDPWLSGCDGAILTTGTFCDARCADDGNPYVASNRVPDYPGEDFLMNLPGDHPAVNLVPNENGNPGLVFLSLEPKNYHCDTTNFPLIPFIGSFPYSRETVIDNTITQQFVLRGWTAQESDTDHGFPWVRVTVERF